MSRINRVTLGSFLIVLLVATLAMPAATRGNDVIIVPARPRIMALAFDVHLLRKMVLISYRGNASSTNPLFHVWDNRQGTWRELSVDEFSFRSLTDAKADRLFLLGSDQDIPGVILETATQARRLYRIESLGTAEAANAFHQHLRFSPREWDALAQKHGFETKELNYEQRRWGRFGPPGTRLQPPSQASQASQTDITGLEQEINPIEIQEKPLGSSVTTESQANDVPETPDAGIIEEDQPPPAFIPDPSSHQPLEPEVPAPPVVGQEILVPAVEEKGKNAEKGSTITESIPEFEALDPADK